MDGGFKEGWYKHHTLGLIRVFVDRTGSWVYQCYTKNGAKPLSRPRPMDSWTWALSEEAEEPS